MNRAFIPLYTAPFTYPHGEDDGVELACQSKCLVLLHAVSVLLVSKGIKLGVQAFVATLIRLISLAFSCCDGHRGI